MTNTNTQNSLEFLSFESAFEKTNEKINKILTTAPLVVRSYTSHLAKSTGKQLRAYALLSCAINEEGLIHPDAVQFASAIEILHLATLVHDDVIDNAGLRRGVITLQKKYGRKTAVICGDYLLATALREITMVADRGEYNAFRLPTYVEQVCMGELKQHINNGNLDLSIYRYLSIINGKTAALFEASFYGGGILCEKDEKVLRNYRNIGRYIGLIFQLTDDCIDFEVEEVVAKKNVQSDYEQGVITLPLIYTFQNNKEFKAKAKDGSLTRDEINTEVVKTGGLKFTKLISKKYYDKAIKLIKQMDFSEAKETQIIQILDKSYYGLKNNKRKLEIGK